VEEGSQVKLLIAGTDPAAFTGTPHPMYRGTQRSWPQYQDQFPEEHEVNQAFLWYIREEYNLDFLEDLERARALVSAYKRYTGQDFDLLEVTVGEEPPELGHNLLGFDISVGWESLLSNGLHLCRDYDDTEPLYAELASFLRNLQPLLCLVERYFQPHLNDNVLFDDYATAKYCLDCVRSLESFMEDLFLDFDHEFQVLGLYKLETD
jgi:hypothetical protein